MTVLNVVLEATSNMAIWGQIGAAMAAAIVAIAASYGISTLGKTALESTARQPEAAGDIRSNMIVSAALIEGVAFFAIVIDLLIVVM